MSTDANDVLFGSGIPAAKFQYPGDTFAGQIMKLEAVQERVFDKKNNRPTDVLATWDNGDPKMVAVATLRTQHRDPSDPSDDGQRKVYITSRDMQNKVKAAVKNAGQRKLDIGGYLSVTYTHEAPSEAGPMAKFYEVSYQPAQAASANAALGIQQPPVQQQVTYATPSPQQQYVNTALNQQPGFAPQVSAEQGGYYQGVPPITQMLPPQAQPVQAQQPVQQAQPAAAAPDATSLESLPPEARALVERMLAGQQQG